MKYLFLFCIFFSIYSYSDDPFQGGVGSFFEPGEDPGDIFRDNPAQRHSDWINFFGKDSWKTKTRAGEEKINKRKEAKKASAGYNASKQETQTSITEDSNWIFRYNFNGGNGNYDGPNPRIQDIYLTYTSGIFRLVNVPFTGSPGRQKVNLSGLIVTQHLDKKKLSFNIPAQSNIYYSVDFYEYIGLEPENQTSGDGDIKLPDTGRQPKPPVYDDLEMERLHDNMPEYDNERLPDAFAGEDEDEVYITAFEPLALNQLREITDEITGYGTQQYATLGDLEFAQYQIMEGDIRREDIQEDIYETLSSIELLLMLAGEQEIEIPENEVFDPGDGSFDSSTTPGEERPARPEIVLPDVTGLIQETVERKEMTITFDGSFFENLLSSEPGNMPVGFWLYLSELNGVAGMNLEDYYIDFTAEPLSIWIGYFRSAISGILILIFAFWTIRILKTFEF